MKIQILDEAQADLREGVEFYEQQNAGLGTYFLDTIFSDIDSFTLLETKFEKGQYGVDILKP